MIIECNVYFKYAADSIADNNLQVLVINFKLSIGKEMHTQHWPGITTLFTHF